MIFDDVSFIALGLFALLTAAKLSEWIGLL